MRVRKKEFDLEIKDLTVERNEWYDTFGSVPGTQKVLDVD